jgi:hypothetical protein
MLALQDQSNAAVDPEWRSLAIPWLRFVVTEGSRGLAIIGPEDAATVAELKSCLVSIWQLILSEALVQKGGEAEAFLARYPQPNVGWGFDGYATRCYDILDLSSYEQWELLIGFAALRAPLYQVVMVFRTLMVDIGLSVEELYQHHKVHKIHDFRAKIELGTR